MNAKILELLIRRAGPTLAPALAQAIINLLARLADKTNTDVDDQIVALIAEALGLSLPQAPDDET